MQIVHDNNVTFTKKYREVETEGGRPISNIRAATLPQPLRRLQ